MTVEKSLQMGSGNDGAEVRIRMGGGEDGGACVLPRLPLVSLTMPRQLQSYLQSLHPTVFLNCISSTVFHQLYFINCISQMNFLAISCQLLSHLGISPEHTLLPPPSHFSLKMCRCTDKKHRLDFPQISKNSLMVVF